MKLAIFLLAAFIAACAPTFAQEPMTEDEKVLHVLNRLTFGPRPGDIEKVKAGGVDAFIDQELNPSNPEWFDSLKGFLGQNPALRLNPLQLFLRYGPPRQARNGDGAGGAGPKVDPSKRKDLVKIVTDRFRQIAGIVIESRLRSNIESPHQFQEVLTDFWFNHFNICMEKGLDNIWVGSFEQQAVRPHTMGKFRDLLGATCHHAAMLFYLDNWQNTAPQSKGAHGKFTGLNENYARELMELHTLGVDGGYSQQDVIALARILTGLGLPDRKTGLGGRANMQSGYVFDKSRHDFSEKLFLGHKIRGSGEHEIEEALDILARHPSTAHHIAFKLAQYFVADAPPPALVDRLAKRFMESDGNIRLVLSDLFHSSEFFDRQYFNCKFKSPYRYVISAFRATGVHMGNWQIVFGFLKQLGMAPYGCLTPDGYKNTRQDWLNPDSLLRRINFATGIGAGKLPGSPSQPVQDETLLATLSGLFGPQTLATVKRADARLKAPLLLGSPEFQNY